MIVGVQGTLLHGHAEGRGRDRPAYRDGPAGVQQVLHRRSVEVAVLHGDLQSRHDVLMRVALFQAQNGLQGGLQSLGLAPQASIEMLPYLTIGLQEAPFQSGKGGPAERLCHKPS